MALLQYYVLVIREVFTHRIDRAQVLLFFLLAIGDLRQLSRGAGGWDIAFALCGSALLIRVLFAHYWLWLEATLAAGAALGEGRLPSRSRARREDVPEAAPGLIPGAPIPPPPREVARYEFPREK